MTLLRLASYNIQYGKGKDDRFDLPRIVADLGDPDIIALQEVEANFSRSGMVDQPAEIAALLPHMHWVFGPGIDVDGSTIINGKIVRRRRQYGNMVLSRWPILSTVTHPLPKIALVGILHQQRCLVETVIATPAGPLRFCSVHLDHVSPDTRMPQVEMMMDLALNGAKRGGNWGGLQGVDAFTDPAPPLPDDVVIMGDMNFTPNSAEYARMIGDMSQWHGRTYRAGGLADAWIAAGHAEMEGDTIPHSDPAVGPRRIDHCFISARLAPFVKTARIDRQAQGSDHNPIFFDLLIEGQLR
jgi:endonuclease/exonuclease/phosphatase family metal-dependent hydrolase